MRDGDGEERVREEDGGGEGEEGEGEREEGEEERTIKDEGDCI